jgi:hypothetical protein
MSFITVYNLKNQVLFCESNTSEINLVNYPKGVYVVKGVSGNSVYNFTLLKH